MGLPKIAFSLGDTVRVADGPFESQTGTVEEIDPERGVLRVSVNKIAPKLLDGLFIVL